MKVFLTWSGEVSRRVAILLRDWLPSVIQALEPYVSSEDIEKGARWSVDLGKELEATNTGILCVTRDNVNAPWINFEAGVLWRALDASRVTPLLIGLRVADVPSGHPLLQFQACTLEKADVLRLINTLNKQLGERRLIDERVERAFERWWPDLETNLRKITAANASTRPQPEVDTGVALQELVELSRSQQKMMVSLIERVPEAPDLDSIFRGEAEAKNPRGGVDVLLHDDDEGCEAKAETPAGFLVKRKFSDRKAFVRSLRQIGAWVPPDIETITSLHLPLRLAARLLQGRD